jgi:hypothetical protein
MDLAELTEVDPVRLVVPLTEGQGELDIVTGAIRSDMQLMSETAGKWGVAFPHVRCYLLGEVQYALVNHKLIANENANNLVSGAVVMNVRGNLKSNVTLSVELIGTCTMYKWHWVWCSTDEGGYYEAVYDENRLMWREAVTCGFTEPREFGPGMWVMFFKFSGRNGMSQSLKCDPEGSRTSCTGYGYEVKYSLITRFKTDKKSTVTKRIPVKVGVADVPTPSIHYYSKADAPVEPKFQQEYFVEGPNDSGAETRNAFWLAYPPCKQLPFHLESL